MFFLCSLCDHPSSYSCFIGFLTLFLFTPSLSLSLSVFIFAADSFTSCSCFNFFHSPWRIREARERLLPKVRRVKRGPGDKELDPGSASSVLLGGGGQPHGAVIILWLKAVPHQLSHPSSAVSAWRDIHLYSYLQVGLFSANPIYHSVVNTEVIPRRDDLLLERLFCVKICHRILYPILWGTLILFIFWFISSIFRAIGVS